MVAREPKAFSTNLKRGGVNLKWLTKTRCVSKEKKDLCLGLELNHIHFYILPLG